MSGATDETVRLFAIELALHLGHAFESVADPVTPGPNTMQLAESIVGGLESQGLTIVPLDAHDALRVALTRAYDILKEQRDNPPPLDEIAAVVADACPLLGLPSADDVRGILNVGSTNV